MKYTKDELIERVNKIDNGEYTLTNDNNLDDGINSKVILKHKCGNIYECKLKGFLNENKSRCPKCKITKNHSTKRVTEKDFISRLKNETNEYEYISGFKNTKTKLKLKHITCGNIFEVSPHMFLDSKKSRCPKCSNKNRGKYAIKENYLNLLLLNTTDGCEYTWLEEYKNNNKLKHKIKHLKCKNEYYVKPNDFQQGYRCPYCKRSKAEELISEVLDKNNIEYEREFKFDDCRNIIPLPFDFKMETDDGKIILIEYDGEFHYKNIFGENILELQKLRDKIKTDYCNSHDNIDLYRISYKQYDNLENIIKNIINKYE